MVEMAPNDFAPGDVGGLEIGMEGGGTIKGGTGGRFRVDTDATELPWDRGRGPSGAGLRNGDDRIPAGNEATGRWSGRDKLPDVRGRPLLSTAGRGPSLIFRFREVEPRSWNDGLADWEDFRDSYEV